MKIFKFIPLWRGKYNIKNKGFTRTPNFGVTPKGGGFTRTPNFGVTPKGGGFTLVETLVAISIFTISILGLLVVLTNGISDTGYAKRKMVASYLAQEGIEYVRNQRDNAVLYDAISPQAGWDSFKTPRAISYPVSGSDFPGFNREVTISAVTGGDEVKVISTVTWTQGSGSFNVVFTEELYNWVE